MSDAQPSKGGLESARQGVAGFASNAQRTAGERLDQVRERARTYGDTAVDQYGQARTYVVERVQEKPVTSALAMLGVGVVLGVLLGLTSQRRVD